MDIIIADRDLDYTRKLMSEISERFEDYRVTFISNQENEFKEFIKSNFFDIAIMEDYFIERCPEIFNYNAQKICIFGSGYKQAFKYIAIRRESETALNDNLAKLLLNNSPKNNDIRQAIRKELEYLGYNLSLRGTKYLEDAINLIYLKNCDCNLEREVYQQLSKKYRKTSHNVKVNIQNSTNMMLSNTDYNKVLEYLALDNSSGIGTKAIICAILNKLQKEF